MRGRRSAVLYHLHLLSLRVRRVQFGALRSSFKMSSDQPEAMEVDKASTGEEKSVQKSQKTGAHDLPWYTACV